MNELKPCPFCGDKATITDGGFSGEQFLVRCRESLCPAASGTVRKTQKQAIAAWNRRAAAVPVVRGEWFVTDAYPHRVYCSLCYKTNVPNEEWLYEKNDYPKYCMWCGAKMEDKQ